MAIIMPYKSAAPKIDESVFLAPTAVVAGDVTIEEGVSVWFGAVVRGDFQPIKIGKNTNIQENATIHVMHDHPTTIGEGVIIGHNAVIHSKSIGDHTLIGMGSIIMGNTVIGENVVIGAGTMIERDRRSRRTPWSTGIRRRSSAACAMTRSRHSRNLRCATARWQSTTRKQQSGSEPSAVLRYYQE